MKARVKLWRGLRRLTGRVAFFFAALALPFMAHWALRRKLHAVYARGNWQALQQDRRGKLLVPNHHSFWDAYLVWLIGKRLRVPLKGVMKRETLETFPFFVTQGAIAEQHLRRALQALGRGEILVLFPEGDIMPPTRIQNHKQGLEYLAKHSAATLYPLAIRVTMRGAELPEAFLSLGAPVASSAAVPAVNDLLKEIDTTLAQAHPEQPPQNWDIWLQGPQSPQFALRWIGALWQREHP